MNEPQFVISGKQRRELKKDLSALKTCLKMFWHWEDIDRVNGHGMADEDCENYLKITKKEITQLENKLNKRLP